MSAEYDKYLREHCSYVQEAFYWIEDNIPQVLSGLDTPPEYWGELDVEHDDSKWDNEEYYAYDNYFYGDKTSKVVKEFDYAWLHHIHNNPHHWQHWVLMEDEGKTKALEMPEKDVIEMVCDWWSFSFKEGDLREIFKWYDDHKGKMILHPNTRKRVEEILDAIDKKLKENEEFQNEEEDVEHSGIKGQKWGVRHGPPYPLDYTKAYGVASEISSWMKKNIKYAEFTKLKSPDEVRSSKTGSCHDQVMYELDELKRRGIDADAKFLIEYNPETNQGGTTHSFVYIKDDKGVVWLENAWGGKEGVHRFASMEEMEKAIRKTHEDNEFGDNKKYPELEISNFKPSKHKYGEDLQTLVNIALEDDDEIKHTGIGIQDVENTPSDDPKEVFE